MSAADASRVNLTLTKKSEAHQIVHTSNSWILPMLFDQHQPSRVPEGQQLNFLPPTQLNVPLWRSLLTNLRDSILPKRLPPLQLTSRPVDVGMLVGDMLEVPWYRTILS